MTQGNRELSFNGRLCTSFVSNPKTCNFKNKEQDNVI